MYVFRYVCKKVCMTNFCNTRKFAIYANICKFLFVYKYETLFFG